jgi:cytochrome c-type biogenesis protein CcmH/NrfF
MAWTNFPMATCPKCGNESQVDDYYDLDVGDSLHCPKCETKLHIWSIDTVIEVDLRIEPVDQ